MQASAAKSKPRWAAALRARREKIVGSQEELAVRAELSQSLVSQIERGVHMPTGLSVERFARLLDALQWTVGEFSAETGLPVPGYADAVGSGTAPAPELAQMIEERSAVAPELQTARWREFLAGHRWAAGVTVDAERWWLLFLSLRNVGIEPS